MHLAEANPLLKRSGKPICLKKLEVSYTVKRRINYVGWVGNNNLGDEAIYAITQDLLSDYELEVYDSFKHLTLPNTPVFQQTKDMPSPVSVFGGGTLLPDDVTWVKPAKYNYVFGTAMKDPSFPSRFDSFDKVIIERLKSFHFRLVGVRDNFSKNSLDSLGIESEVIGDPVLWLRPSSDLKRDRFKIGINVGCDGLLWGGDQDRVVQEMIHVCRILKKEGYDLISVPFSEQDIPYLVTLSEKTGVEIFDEWSNPQAVVDLIANCGVFIGERHHSLVVSAAAYTPFVCLEYRPKCSAFAETVGSLEYCIRTDKVSTENVLERFNHLLDNWLEIRNTLTRRVDQYRKLQLKFVERMKDDIESLPESVWQFSLLSERLKNRLFWDSDVVMRKKMGRVWRMYNRLIFLHLIRFLT